MLSSNHSSRSGLKRFIPSRATDLCNQLVDSSAVALCAADEIMWRYLEASHNPYARLLHKGLTAGPKALDHASIDSTTAEAFNELQAGLAVVEDESLESRLVSATQLIDADEEIKVGRIGRLLTTASVTVAIGVDEAVRALSASRLGGVLGLPKPNSFDTAACAAWNELHNELSSLPADESTSVAGPSSAIATQPKSTSIIRLLSPTAAIKSIAAIPSAVAKRAVTAVPLPDPLLMAIVAAVDRLPQSNAAQAPQHQVSEVEAWDELQSNFSY